MKRAALNFRFFAQLALDLEAAAWESHGTHYQVRRDPSGVAVLITPWNAPLLLETWKCGPALAAGCTAILKPAEWSPLTASLLAEIARRGRAAARGPERRPGHRRGGRRRARRAPGHRAHLVHGLGRDRAARSAGAAAPNLTPVSFELGGKSPFLVFADADLDRAVETATYQYDNAGQVCLAGTRLLVEESDRGRVHRALPRRRREAEARRPARPRHGHRAAHHPRAPRPGRGLRRAGQARRRHAS